MSTVRRRETILTESHKRWHDALARCTEEQRLSLHDPIAPNESDVVQLFPQGRELNVNNALFEIYSAAVETVV